MAAVAPPASFMDKQTLSKARVLVTGELEYIAFPEALKGKYQAFTQANLENLRKAGCDVEFRTVQEGTREYMQNLLAAFPNVEE